MQEPAIQSTVQVTPNKRRCLACNCEFSEATMYLLSNPAGEVKEALCVECYQNGTVWAAKMAREFRQFRDFQTGFL